MARLGRYWTAIAIPLLLIALVLPTRLDMAPEGVERTAGPPYLTAAALVYLFAHVLRAARFSLIAARIVPLRMRTMGMLYFNAAPVSLLVPFKLGELYRLQQLVMLAGNIVRPLLILLLEKAFDAFVLLVALAILVGTGTLPSALYPLSFMLLLLLAAGVATLTVLRPALGSIQQYIVEVHFSSRSLKVLRFLDFMRHSTEIAKACIKGNLGSLLCLSVMIWMLEALTLALIVPAMTGGTTLLAVSSLSLSLTPGTGLLGASSDLVLLYGVIATASLLFVWPFATLAYLQQVTQPDWRPLRPVVLDTPPVRLAAFAEPRSLRLHVARKSL